MEATEAELDVDQVEITESYCRIKFPLECTLLGIVPLFGCHVIDRIEFPRGFISMCLFMF